MLLIASVLAVLPLNEVQAFGGQSCPAVDANDWQQLARCCGVELPDSSAETDLGEDNETQIEAGNTILHRDQTVQLMDGVKIRHGSWQIEAEEIIWAREKNRFKADNALFKTPKWRADAAQLKISERQRSGELQDLDFELFRPYLQGTAASLSYVEKILEIKEVRFSHCPSEREFWKFTAERLYLNPQTDTGIVDNVRLYLGKVPVLWLPWLSFPLSDKGKTGLLVPKFKYSSKDGLHYKQPYYLKLAEHHDLTLTGQHITRRGTLLDIEYRHLSRHSLWTVGSSWLERDKIIRSDYENGDLSVEDALGNRWLHRISQQGQYGTLRTRIDYSKVSDRYFEDDFDPDFPGVARDYLTQRAELQWQLSDWTVESGFSNYQALRNYTPRYRKEPWLQIRLRERLRDRRINPLFNLSYIDYAHSSSTLTDNRQLYLETGLIYPLSGRYGSLKLWAKIKHLVNEPSVGEKEDTTVFSGGFDAHTEFSRISSDKRWLQILEPRLYYIYTERKTQRLQVNFDSRQLEFNSAQLFRESRFSGHDRIDDANRLSLAFTHRWIERDSGHQWLEITAGQVYYFADREIMLHGENRGVPEDYDYRRDTSALSFYVNYTPPHKLQWDSEILYDQQQNRLDSFDGSLYFKRAGGSMKLGYRFARAGILSEDEQSQLRLKGEYSLNPSWSLYGLWNYDTRLNRNYDIGFGFEYISCCWKIKMGIARELDRSGNNDNSIEFSFSLGGKLAR